MKNLRFIYILPLAIPAMLMFACSQLEEDIDMPDSVVSDDILFYTSLPGVESRSYDNIEIGHLVGGFSVTAMDLNKPVPQRLDMYFENVPVEKTPGMGDAFRGDGCKWPDNKDGNEGLLQFFAYYPSIETLKKNAVIDPGDNTDYFLVHHPANDLSQHRDTGYWFNYRMGNYLINRDISTHSDFVAASTRGSKTANLFSGVKLDFQHKLSRVDLKAWGAPKGYAVEIAGVRIGGVITRSTYNLAGNWIHNTNGIVWNSVDYIYRHGDKVVTIGSGDYATKEKAVSIMGNGGYALMIPHQRSNLASGFPAKWDITKNPTNVNKSNANVKGSNAGMYLSVLMRVIDKTDDQGLVLYPYVDGALITGTTVKANNNNVVYLVVDKANGNVVKRLYRNAAKQYFTDEAKTVPFSVNDLLASEEIRTYGWAAIPYVATWYIGNKYTYILDYTNGVGLHAPDDDAPGKPIITGFAVGVSEASEVWKMVKDYDSELIDLEKGKDFTQE